MRKSDLVKVLEIIHRPRGSCLCGHSESCSCCDGTERRLLQRICEDISKEFGSREVEITISTRSKYDLHKVTVTPSVAVNPPAVQYFTGIDHAWVCLGWKDTDNRLPAMVDFVVTILSSSDYPNLRICTKKRAREIAKLLLPRILKRIGEEEVDITLKARL